MKQLGFFETAVYNDVDASIYEEVNYSNLNLIVYRESEMIKKLPPFLRTFLNVAIHRVCIRINCQ